MLATSHQTYAHDVLEASRARPVLVDFWGPRCGPCLKMMPWVERLAERAADRLTVLKLNSAENRRLCIEQRVLGLPTFILYQDGHEVERLTGDGCTPSSIIDLLRARVPDLADELLAPCP